jgi:hypothetical protein
MRTLVLTLMLLSHSAFGAEGGGVDTLEERVQELPCDLINKIVIFMNFKDMTGIPPDKLKSERDKILQYRTLFSYQFTMKLWCAVCGLPISKQDGDPVFTIAKDIVHHKKCFTD